MTWGWIILLVALGAIVKIIIAGQRAHRRHIERTCRDDGPSWYLAFLQALPVAPFLFVLLWLALGVTP